MFASVLRALSTLSPCKDCFYQYKNKYLPQASLSNIFVSRTFFHIFSIIRNIATTAQWRAEVAGERSRSPTPGRHPWSKVTKIKNAELDDFSYCKATNTCCIDLIFRNNSFVSQHEFLRIQMPVILTFFNTIKNLYSRCAVRTQSN